MEDDCADLPGRLSFTGATLGDDPVPVGSMPFAIGVGGIQNIEVWLGGEPFSELPESPQGSTNYCSSPEGPNPPAFCAEQGGMNVLKIRRSSPPVVTVEGLVAGRDNLRITATRGEGPGMLYDQVSLDVVELSHMHVVTPPELEFQLLHGLDLGQLRDTPIAFAVNSQPSGVVIGMFGVRNGQHERIVDEAVSFTSLPGDLASDPDQWDTLVPGDQFTSSARDQVIVVTSGSGDPLGHVTVKVVDIVSRLALADGAIGKVEEGESLIVGATKRACFSSFASAGMGANLLVYGAELHFEPAYNVTVTPVTGDPHVNAACVDLRPTSAGVATIRITSTPPLEGGFRLFSFEAIEAR